ncbi:MAG: threonine--tRNA ligase [bacterium]
MKIILPDKKELDLNNGATGADAAKAIGTGLYKAALAIRVNGILKDLNATLRDKDNIAIVTNKDPLGLEIIRHSTAHLMAQAVRQLFKDVKVAIGPIIEDGFYYDFDLPDKITPEDFPRIENRMNELIEKDIFLRRKELNKAEAIEKYRNEREIYKVDLLEKMSDEKVSIYEQDDFTDLCRGPHVPSTGRLGNFKLLSVAGAYWRGDEKNQMLQRIYAAAFLNKKDLQEHISLLAEAEKRDHRKLGRELDLFSLHGEAGPGLVYWHPKGVRIRNKIEEFWKGEHYKNGYELIISPHIGKAWLWEKSGHLEFYKENMYAPMEIDDNDYYIKPMNCPFHIMIYKNAKRSYREFPIRWAELGTVYRYEKTGVLHGLLRVRGFTQDDAHIFCREDQLEEEITEVMRFVIFILNSFGFDSGNYALYISTRPEKFVGEIALWDKATNALKSALTRLNLEFQLDEGEGTFYGPKIDLKIKDALKRVWQCSTVQVDFNLPERFDISYIDKSGNQARPIMIHRALMGSLERFFAMLVEHYGGDFPLWLAPVQLRVIPISENHNNYAKEVADFFKANGIQSELDYRNEKVGYKIRDAEINKIPYAAVVGEKEMSAKTIALRRRKKGELGNLTLSNVLDMLIKEINNKS